jgi:hypothetical protein
MKYLDDVKWMLGMEVTRDRNNNTLFINQKVYIEKLLQKFNMVDCNTTNTSATTTKLTTLNCPTTTIEKHEMSKRPYRQLVGSLLYAAISSRPDISYAVNAISRFNCNPGKTHWTASKRVLRNLKNTQDSCLFFSGNSISNPTEINYQLTGYCDADCGGNIDDRKSTTGYLIMLNNCIIIWNSKRQTTVAQSSTEAEYMTITAIANDIKWINTLLTELTLNVQKPITIYCDNQSAIQISKHDLFHNRTKHIDIKYHLIRNEIKNKFIDIKHKESSNQLADILQSHYLSKNFQNLQSKYYFAQTTLSANTKESRTT